MGDRVEEFLVCGGWREDIGCHVRGFWWATSWAQTTPGRRAPLNFTQFGKHL
jgi:hypothetical protein